MESANSREGNGREGGCMKMVGGVLRSCFSMINLSAAEDAVTLHSLLGLLSHFGKWYGSSSKQGVLLLKDIVTSLRIE